MKIFISIASYQDPLLEATLRSAYDKSDMPKNLVFGVCDQSSKSLNLESIEFRSQIKYEHINPLYSKGPCWARSRIQDNFNEEDYYLQIDSHMQFEKGWDSYLIKHIKKIQSVNSEMHQLPVITCYPRSFDVIDINNNKFENDDMVFLFQPTSVFRNLKFLDAFISEARKLKKGESLISVSQIKKISKIKDNVVEPISYNFGDRSQDVDNTKYVKENGLGYAFHIITVKENGLFGKYSKPFISDKFCIDLDIDTKEDYLITKNILENGI